MITGSLPRKLAAIFSADVAGYSRLTAADEEGTHRALRASLDRIALRVEQLGGHLDHYTGDGVLADFPTVSEAVACAVAVQRDVGEVNGTDAATPSLSYRIGINLGEVIVDRGEIYGDGVNVAVRLQELAPAGGIYLSEAARSAVGAKLPLRYEFLGEQTVKNVPVPVRIFEVVPQEPDLGWSGVAASALGAPVAGLNGEGNEFPERSVEGGLKWGLREDFVSISADSFRAARASHPTIRGREREVAAMREHLQAVTDGSRMVFLHGPIGVGKTALAVEWWRLFGEQRRQRVPYVLMLDCAAFEGAQNLALDIAHTLFDAPREALERNFGVLVDEIVAVSRIHDMVLVLDNLERAQAPAEAGEFRDYIRGDAGRLMLRLMHPSSRARIVACSQRYAPQVDWDISGRILPLEVRALKASAGAEVIRDLVAHRGTRIDEQSALRLSQLERGVPLNLVSAALAYAKHGEIATLASAVWKSDNFADNMQRYCEHLSPRALAILRIVSLSEEGLTLATLVEVLGQERALLDVNGAPFTVVREAAVEAEPMITVTGGRRTDDAVYRVGHLRVRNFFRAQWENSPAEGAAARRIHRLLARVAWFRGESWRASGGETAAGLGLSADLRFPPEGNPYDGSVRALKRYIQCLHHALASVDPHAPESTASGQDAALTRDDAPAALSTEADAGLVVRFAYQVVYRQLIERGDQSYLSRALEAHDTQLDLLARFFNLGSSTIDLTDGLVPGTGDGHPDAKRPALRAPRHLAPSDQDRLLFALGIAAHWMGEVRVAEAALDATFAQRRQREDRKGAAKVLTTIADLQIQAGAIGEWIERCSYFLWEFASWDPEFSGGRLEELAGEQGQDRARVVSELLGRYAYARLYGDGAVAALPYFRRAETIKALSGNGRAYLDGNVGRRYRQALVRAGDHAAAESGNRRASERSRGKKHETALLAMDRASIYRASERLDFARIALEEAAALTRNSGTSRTVLFEYRLEESRLAIESGETDAITTTLEEVRWRAKTRSLAIIETDALLLLADAHPGGSERDRLLDEAESIIERIGYGYRLPDLEIMRNGGSAVRTLKV